MQLNGFSRESLTSSSIGLLLWSCITGIVQFQAHEVQTRLPDWMWSLRGRWNSIGTVAHGHLDRWRANKRGRFGNHFQRLRSIRMGVRHMRMNRWFHCESTLHCWAMLSVKNDWPRCSLRAQGLWWWWSLLASWWMECAHESKWAVSSNGKGRLIKWFLSDKNWLWLRWSCNEVTHCLCSATLRLIVNTKWIKV